MNSPTLKISELKSRIKTILDQAVAGGVNDANSTDFESDLILFHVMRKQDSAIRSLTDLRLQAPSPNSLSEESALQFGQLRAQGKPLQHILGTQFFYEHEYEVDSSTLIPRPETEILVDAAIQWVGVAFADRNFNFAELGLGTSIISAEVLSRFKNASGVASEANPRAIELARRNLKSIVGADYESRFHILEATSTEAGFEIFAKHAPFDLLLSNPPYVSRDDEIQAEVLKHEPHLALFPEVSSPTEQPNFFYENFCTHARMLLTENGVAFFEIPHERAQSIYDLFAARDLKSLRLIPDLTGRNRVLQAGF